MNGDLALQVASLMNLVYGDKEHGTFYAVAKNARRRGQRRKEKETDILTSFNWPKWPIRPNKRLHVKCCLVFGNNKSK